MSSAPQRDVVTFDAVTFVRVLSSSRLTVCVEVGGRGWGIETMLAKARQRTTNLAEMRINDSSPSLKPLPNNVLLFADNKSS